MFQFLVLLVRLLEGPSTGCRLIMQLTATSLIDINIIAILHWRGEPGAPAYAFRLQTRGYLISLMPIWGFPLQPATILQDPRRSFRRLRPIFRLVCLSWSFICFISSLRFFFVFLWWTLVRDRRWRCR